MRKTGFTIMFLRLFACFRTCERALDEVTDNWLEATKQIREIQGQLGELRDEVRCLKEERDKASGQERSAYQMLINVEYKQRYGITPFPDSPSIPDITTDLTPVGGTMSARQATKTGRELFRQELSDLVDMGETQ